MISIELPGNPALSTYWPENQQHEEGFTYCCSCSCCFRTRARSGREIRRRCVLNYFELCISKFCFALPTKFIIRGAAALRGIANDGKVFMVLLLLLMLVLQVLCRCCCRCCCCSDSSEFMQEGAAAAKRRASSVSHLAAFSSWRCHDVISFCGRHII